MDENYFVGDFPIEEALFHYREKHDEGPRMATIYQNLYRLMARFKILSEDFQIFLSNFTFDYSVLRQHRDDWFREALMSCLELGIGMTAENALRLLSDRAYFESLLPLPIDSDEWGNASGTELVRQWWLLASDEYRRYHLITFEKNTKNLDAVAVKRALACHPKSGNRGKTKEYFESAEYWSSQLNIINPQKSIR